MCQGFSETSCSLSKVELLLSFKCIVKGMLEHVFFCHFLYNFLFRLCLFVYMYVCECVCVCVCVFVKHIVNYRDKAVYFYSLRSYLHFLVWVLREGGGWDG